MAAEHTGTNQQRPRDTAKELSDKKDFVNLLNKVANLLDEVPEDDGEEDENEDDECDESDESDIPQPILDIINKMEKDGEKVVVNENTTIVKMDSKQTMDLLKELAKDSEEEDCDCTRGKCEHDCKCGKSKCSGKSKKS